MTRGVMAGKMAVLTHGTQPWGTRGSRLANLAAGAPLTAGRLPARPHLRMSEAWDRLLNKVGGDGEMSL